MSVPDARSSITIVWGRKSPVLWRNRLGPIFKGMNENGNRYALAALKERRASIDGEMRECERRLRYFRETLGHLDATLALFDPEGNPKAIRAKRPYKRVKLFGAGKLSRLILDALRKAERPLSAPEVTAAVVAELDYGPEAAPGHGDPRPRDANLSRQARKRGQRGRAGDGGMETKIIGIMQPASLLRGARPAVNHIARQCLPRDHVAPKAGPDAPNA
jgi:hypothetical protein